jgi:hypothetical protein
MNALYLYSSIVTLVRTWTFIYALNSGYSLQHVQCDSAVIPLFVYRYQQYSACVFVRCRYVLFSCRNFRQTADATPHPTGATITYLWHLNRKELNKLTISRHATSLLYFDSATRIFRNHSCRLWQSAALSRLHLLHYLSGKPSTVSSITKCYPAVTTRWY